MCDCVIVWLYEYMYVCLCVCEPLCECVYVCVSEYVRRVVGLRDCKVVYLCE